MIVVTRLNGTEKFAVNPDLIERIHASPDTTLVMVGGARHIIAESMADTIRLVTAYRAQIIGMAQSTDLGEQGQHPYLSIVHPYDDPSR